jgi:hypothetical protein
MYNLFMKSLYDNWLRENNVFIIKYLSLILFIYEDFKSFNCLSL